MTERELKAKLVRKIRQQLRGAVVFRHEDLWTAGIPDISITWRGKTIWLEVKVVRKDGKLKMRAVQKLTCQNLADNGNCAIVIYEDHKIFGPKTHFLNSQYIDNWDDDVIMHMVVDGYDHDFVINELKICVA